MKAFNHEMHVGSNRTRFHVRRWSGCGGRFPNTQVGRGHGGVEQADPSKSLSESPTPEKRILGWAREEVGADHGSGDPWKGLSFPREVKELIEEGKRWLASEEWYKARRIPWRRGWLLYGKPGTGKTAFVRAMAQDLNLPLVVFDLASFGNGEFIEKWHRLLEMAPCVALIEDIDCVFKGRDNRLGEDGGGLSFDCLLNCLSGVESADGILTVVTTNRVEDLDEALGTPGEGGISTRPGRIDRAVEMLPLDEQCRRKVARNIVGDSAMAEPLVYQGEGLTGAQFQDLCAKAALAIYWRAEKCNGRQPQEVADASGSRQ
jgi:SpoVK/Ycf46/Vps4 family AAA+-type ATPase